MQVLATKIIVHLDDRPLTFASILPEAGAPWFSIGDRNSLRQIGEVLDTLPANGSNDPSWSTAQAIATIFQKYVEDGSTYTKHYMKRNGDKVYAPGICMVSPIYDGLYNRWSFYLLLITTSGCTVEVSIGLDKSMHEERLLVVNFKSHGSQSSTMVQDNFNRLGITAEANETKESEQQAA